MKTFQIVGGFCYKDITDLAKKTDLSYITALHYEETPDYVFAGWGFDETKEGDARFIQPEPPEGWGYDADTGTFYDLTQGPPVKQPTDQERIEALEAENNLLKAQVTALADNQEFLEDCLIEVGQVVYA